MIYTSYFSNLKNIPKDYVAISISLRQPKGFNLVEYKKLAPTPYILKEYKIYADSTIYTANYEALILDNLNPQKVVDELYEIAMNLLHKTSKEDINIVLVCWEKEKFCHRHLVARWINNNTEEKVKEYPYIKTYKLPLIDGKRIEIKATSLKEAIIKFTEEHSELILEGQNETNSLEDLVDYYFWEYDLDY